ncbi:P27 family phage terminase small subunit [Vagococcus carniphilus]|uniref:P27 family phage terminase small subunit n=1 Tax=Vagococcus carniphilus TaxID=218144 RepID=UPI0028909F52|nr:P27 family phage terminase small subunit [Vagococcus carniphilus]MDT2850169.1 P27 family phage terminase small subunit [Vagococcus carniphilus]
MSEKDNEKPIETSLPENFDRFKLVEIREFALENNIIIPTNIKKKKDIVQFIKNTVEGCQKQQEPEELEGPKILLPDNFESLKLVKIKEFANDNEIVIPNYLRKKDEIIQHIYRMVNMDLINELVELEKSGIVSDMQDTNIYSRLLNPMINSYLETYEIYITMYTRWRNLGFPETQSYTNKAGANNQIKHPLAQMVEVWSEKRMKSLERLGLTNKNLVSMQIVGGKVFNPVQEGVVTKPDQNAISQLEAHRNKWRA